ncbi:MAG TPA: RNA chaperone Hfq [Terriglobales bacterium]|nr:RNA chaperone Hfq [Terriglobales bacterium]
MKDSLDATAVERAPEAEEFSNRKLIRPLLNHNNERNHRSEAPMERRDRSNNGPGPRKNLPLEQTNAENFYYQKQMQSHTPMVVVLQDGEEIHGVIEWYDKNCIKMVRNGQPNIMVYKPSIKYMYKESENGRK